MRRAFLVAVAVAAFAGPILMAQVGGAQAGGGQSSAVAAQAQGQPAAPPKSTALILGQVIDGSTGQPIADAIVTLVAPGGRGANPLAGLGSGASPAAQQAMQAAMASALQAAGRGASGPLSVLTGADGRFVFHGLAPGQYRLTASLTGYVASLTAGAAGGGGAGLAAVASLLAAGGSGSQGAATSLALKEGEFATNVKMRLWKQAVVSGTVMDDTGAPAIGVNVQVARRVMVAGRARYVPANAATTDDRGAYRISGLTPGNYLVVIPQSPVAIPAAVFSNLIDSLTGGGSVGAGWAALDLVTSGIELGSMSGGVRIGDYMVATSGLTPILSDDGHLQAFQTLFYPGATTPAQASVLTLASGEERANQNFQLRLISTSRISGVAMGPDGPVANLGVRLVVPGDGVVSDSDIDVASTLSRPDGTFAFFGVPPGQFQLRAVKQARPVLPAEAMADPTFSAMFGGGAKGPTETLFASEAVSVGGSDIEGLALQLTTGFHVSGRVEFASASGKPSPPAAQMPMVTVTLVSPVGDSPAMLLAGLMGPDRVTAQGDFKTKGYAPGRYVLNVTAPQGWQVKSAQIGGRDVLDGPLEITNADLSGVVVTFTDRMAQVSGTVSAPGETDLSEVSVILFPDNYRAWIANGMSTRLAKTSRASRNGTYAIPNLPAGEYLVAAIDRASEGDLQDPAFIEALSRIGSRVTVASDPVTLDVTRARVVIR